MSSAAHQLIACCQQCFHLAATAGGPKASQHCHGHGKIDARSLFHTRRKGDHPVTFGVVCWCRVDEPHGRRQDRFGHLHPSGPTSLLTILASEAILSSPPLLVTESSSSSSRPRQELAHLSQRVFLAPMMPKSEGEALSVVSTLGLLMLGAKVGLAQSKRQRQKSKAIITSDDDLELDEVVPMVPVHKEHAVNMIYKPGQLTKVVTEQKTRRSLRHSVVASDDDMDANCSNQHWPCTQDGCAICGIAENIATQHVEPSVSDTTTTAQNEDEVPTHPSTSIPPPTSASTDRDSMLALQAEVATLCTAVAALEDQVVAGDKRCEDANTRLAEQEARSALLAERFDELLWKLLPAATSATTECGAEATGELAAGELLASDSTTEASSTSADPAGEATGQSAAVPLTHTAKSSHESAAGPANLVDDSPVLIGFSGGGMISHLFVLLSEYLLWPPFILCIYIRSNTTSSPCEPTCGHHDTLAGPTCIGGDNIWARMAIPVFLNGPTVHMEKIGQLLPCPYDFAGRD
ncbi:hypothetical protein DFJ58DRAFT_841964 [Suillus subalutaceus]|uniref:uncharacterized protein n=1 Tax=Suillus subalutaceus TaxID=48586 RepID=UPI001B85DF67|nr:uncharacterized protein DFJ58DRAFT_841964 [Suillus subalutaceus]KAG1852101.1 hypothetical protein DFJ58DRAFT_841964 [Suillus subalutaceus]